MSGRRDRRWHLGGGAALAFFLCFTAGCNGAQPPREGAVVARVEARPDSVLIGEPLRVRYEVRAPLGHEVAFPPRPEEDSLWSWRSWELGKRAESTAGVHHELLGTALAFRTGRLDLPAARYRVTAPDGTVQVGNFPPLRVSVGSVLPPGNPRPDIRPAHPPLAAPWWTRVPWLWLAAAALLVALGWWLWRRRPRRVKRTEAVPVVAAPSRPDHLVALEALAGLRRERLPEKGLWYEHQSRLSEILRRFVEARFGTPLPGYTSRELCLHLAWRGLDAPAVDRLSRLLRTADLAKFARAEPTLETAHELESEAETLIGAWAPAPVGDAAAAPVSTAAKGVEEPAEDGAPRARSGEGA